MSRRAISVPLALVLSSLASLFGLGCGAPPAPAAGFERELGGPAGCSDVLMYTRNGDDTLAVVFRSSGMVAAARAAGHATTAAILLPQSGASLQLLQGERLTGNYCSDYILSGTEPKIAVERSAVSGTASLTITPDPGSETAKGTLILSDIVFTDGSGGSPVSLGSLELRNVSVGWLPG